jgi:ATP-dependent DNA helicase RecQ
VLLRGNEDRDIQDHFIRVAFPPQEQAEAVMELLASKPGGGPVTMTEIESAVNARRMRIEAMLKVLEVEGAIERGDKGWFRTTQPWAYDAERVATVTRLRREEQAAMVEYATTDGCRMAFLRTQLDDVGGAAGLSRCGRCDNCTGTSSDVELDPGRVAEAVQFLRASRLEVEPRRQWPAGIDEAKGRIPKDEQLQPGRALGLLGDGGWGSVVAGLLRGADAEAAVSDDVAKAAVALVRAWAPVDLSGRPIVTWIPSTARPNLVESLAARLAEELGWEPLALVRRVRPMPPQSEMANSAQQLRNVFRAFGIVDPPPDRAVLLVDDVAESRWTLTVVGGQLIRAGSGPVFPFVLVKAGGG